MYGLTDKTGEGTAWPGYFEAMTGVLEALPRLVFYAFLENKKKSRRPLRATEKGPLWRSRQLPGVLEAMPGFPKLWRA